MTGTKTLWLRGCFASLLLPVAVLVWAQSPLHQAENDETAFRFVILGDRTGEAFPGAYEEAWRETDADHPDFVITVGDTIQGGDDDTAEAEWRDVRRMLAPYRKYRMFFVPGNHDVWSPASADLYKRYTARALHYSFTYKQAHFTILNNSETDSLSPEEIAYLKRDLQANASRPLKFVFFHRPSWLLHALLKSPNSPLHQLALQYGVQYVITGHLHEMLHFELGPVTYLSMASSGGHLREPKTYETGWFFQHTLVTVKGKTADFAIKELKPPFGEGRVSALNDWGTENLLKLKP
ncbi:MAG: metallophosphoesterase family protein [Bryobacteraceae bacterium]